MDLIIQYHRRVFFVNGQVDWLERKHTPCYNHIKGGSVMCDTLGRIGQNRSIFAKNSDRSPNEAQVLEFHSEKTGLSGQVQCTYISIPQAENTYAVLLSRPQWMWGAEMGVNAWGLCIGNEAVFTKGAYGKTGLTGMDLVRLGLERSKTAKEALLLIIQLLKTYGQGGNCGYDHDFYYDNAFLIMDRRELYVLETAGKHWAYKRFDMANISNRLSLGADADAYSDGSACHFRKRYTEPVFTTFSGSGKRWQQIHRALPKTNTLWGAMTALKCHDDICGNPFAMGSVSSACMHYGGLVGDHTTASMVVSLEENRTVVWSTGSSVPCVSLMKPWVFGTETVLPVTLPEDPAGGDYWCRAEAFRRSLLGKQVPESYYEELNQIQQRWIQQAEQTPLAEFTGFSAACLQEEAAFYHKWSQVAFPEANCTKGFRSRWEKKNNAMVE